MTRRWVSARGLMSRTATNPSRARTWSPSRASRQNRQPSRSDDPLLGDGRGPRPHERPHRRAHEPGRVVVAVAAAGPVDEDGVDLAELPAPAGAARRVGGLAEPGAPFLLHGRRDAVLACGDGAGPGRVRGDVDLRDPSLGDGRERAGESVLVLAGEADDG